MDFKVVIDQIFSVSGMRELPSEGNECDVGLRGFGEVLRLNRQRCGMEGAVAVSSLCVSGRAYVRVGSEVCAVPSESWSGTGLRCPLGC